MKNTTKHLSLAAAIACSQFVSSQELEASNTPVEETFVLGQLIVRPLQETPESVAVLTDNFIAEHSLFDLEDVYNQTANAYSLANGENFGIRGVSANSSSTGGGAGDLGSLYIDGVAYTGFSSRFGPKTMWDVEQIEILRGPQSTNFGRNALIGAVVLKTRDADPEALDGAVRVDLGNFDKRGIEAMFNAPITDTAALRFTAESLESDGFNENITQGIDDYDARSDQTARAKLFLAPVDALNIRVNTQYVKSERGQDIYLVGADVSEDELRKRQSTANLEGYETYEAKTASVNVDYALSELLDLSSITSYISGEYDRFDDDDEGPEGGNAFRGREAKDENISQEFRLSLSSDGISGVAGIYYTDVDLENTTLGLVNIDPAQVNVPEALLPFYPANLEISVFSPALQATTNTAFYTEWDFNLSRLTFHAGFRYDNEELDYKASTSNALAEGTVLPDPAAAGAQAELLSPGLGPTVEAGVTAVNAALTNLLSPTDEPEINTNYEAFLPKLGVSFKLNDALNLSAMYKRGYRAGGVETELSGEVSEYDPETLDNFELSLRSTLLDGDLTVNANAYFGDWQDQQVSDCEDGSTVLCQTINAGSSEIYGFELDTVYYLSEVLGIYASYGYSQTKFNEFVTDGEDFSGSEFAFSPNHTLSVGGRYELSDVFSIAASANYQDESWGYFDNEIELDSRTIFDLTARYELDRWVFVAYGKNITDELYLINDNLSLNDSEDHTVRAGAPREIGLQIQFSL